MTDYFLYVCVAFVYSIALFSSTLIICELLFQDNSKEVVEKRNAAARKRLAELIKKDEEVLKARNLHFEANKDVYALREYERKVRNNEYR